ncbi:MAG: hypothetical protein QOD62_2529 [Actinomycetota bacterium]|nr:hypothetical protein [Actinomycetota bacterium]
MWIKREYGCAVGFPLRKPEDRVTPGPGFGAPRTRHDREGGR